MICGGGSGRYGVVLVGELGGEEAGDKRGFIIISGERQEAKECIGTLRGGWLASIRGERKGRLEAAAWVRFNKAWPEQSDRLVGHVQGSRAAESRLGNMRDMRPQQDRLEQSSSKG